jgi:DNA-binding NarL/FixJ family response regulator
MGERRPPEPLRVVIADDHPYYRKGLARSLQASGIEVVAEAPNGEAAIRAVERTAPDVVVMDLNMPGLSGLSGVEATRVLTRQSRASVLVLSVSADEADVTDALLAGARGYVLKDRPVEEVIAGIRAAAAGESHISPALAMLLLRRLREPAGAKVDLTGVCLSAEESDVLTLVAVGRDDYEIAERLGISVDSARAHASTILAKLQLDDRVHAALRAYRRRHG